MGLATRLHMMPRLGMGTAVLLLPQYTFTVWCLTKQQMGLRGAVLGWVQGHPYL
jgi:hypothetical protein